MAFTVPKLGYEHPDLGDEPRPDPTAEARMRLVRAVGETAEHFYPGHPWKIEIKAPNKPGDDTVIQIQIPHFMGPTTWYAIPTSRVRTPNDLRQHVMLGCGEILERYRVPRQNFNHDHFANALHSLPPWAAIHGHVPV